MQTKEVHHYPLYMWKVLYRLPPNDLNTSSGESGRLGIKAKLPALSRLCKESAYISAFMTHHLQWWALDSGMQSQRMLNVTRLWRVLKMLCTRAWGRGSGTFPLLWDICNPPQQQYYMRLVYQIPVRWPVKQGNLADKANLQRWQRWGKTGSIYLNSSMKSTCSNRFNAIVIQ